jgi:vacuolar protein sorting-associated protein 26
MADTRDQIMDGSPSRGETIPIRLFLGGFDLTPTFRDVNKKFSTRYYLSLVLIDEGKLHTTLGSVVWLYVLTTPPDARRYFKQSEIILYRQAPELIQNGADGLPLPREDKITSVPA